MARVWEWGWERGVRLAIGQEGKKGQTARGRGHKGCCMLYRATIIFMVYEGCCVERKREAVGEGAARKSEGRLRRTVEDREGNRFQARYWCVRPTQCALVPCKYDRLSEPLQHGAEMYDTTVGRQ